MIALSFQYARQEDTAEERGPASLRQAIDAFRAFPWQEQLAEAKKLELCSPTLFLKDGDDGSVFFASIMLGDKLDFMLFFEAEEEDDEGWTLLGKRMKKQRVTDDSTGHDSKEVEAAITAYYSDRAKLKKLIHP